MPDQRGIWVRARPCDSRLFAQGAPESRPESGTIGRMPDVAARVLAPETRKVLSDSPTNSLASSDSDGQVGAALLESPQLATDQDLPARTPKQKSLSPSRANDFQQCPLLFRFKTIDRMPEPHSAAAKRGSLVHAVLERLFDAPRGSRTPELATSLVPGEWAKMLAEDETLVALFADDGDAAGVSEETWIAHASKLLSTYFKLENPNSFEPAHRESWIRHELDNGLMLRGIIDRLDIAPDGQIRVVDYKTGKSPRPGYEDKVLFQMQFYALAIWREHGRVPTLLQLLYLGDGQVLHTVPTETQLENVESHIRALWATIERYAENGMFPPRKSKLCGWCSFQTSCPIFGSTPPPFDEELARYRLGL